MPRSTGDYVKVELMTRRLLAVGILALIAGCSAAGPAESPPTPSVAVSSAAPTPTAEIAPPETLGEPPMPFADWGACPFEGCQYGEWTALSEIVALKDPPFPSQPGPHNTAEAFKVARGEKVFAATGVMFFTKPGRVRVDKPLRARLDSGRFPINSQEVPLSPGDIVYLLTPQGEGWVLAWFKGVFIDYDASSLENGGCSADCAGELLERGQSEWWIQLRSSRGEIGWTNRPQQFDGRDRFG